MRYYKIGILTGGLLGWIVLFIENWRIGLALFCILWAENINKNIHKEV